MDQINVNGAKICPLAEQANQSTNYLASKLRIRISDLAEAKRRNQKWAMLTSYDSISATIFDKAGIPCLLIGDSAAQVVYGYKSTIPVTLDELIPLARAVSSSCQRALVIADLPFGSYQESPEMALRSAMRLMKECGVHGVKLEGGLEFAAHVRLLTRSGIPVLGHIGLLPQSEHQFGGYKVQGRNESSKTKLMYDAEAIRDAGAFACVLELVKADIVGEITKMMNIPIIGIGAGPHCDAQILVWTDMAGFVRPVKSTSSQGQAYLSNQFNDKTEQSMDKQKLEMEKVPKFVKKFSNLGEMLYEAALAYANDVSSGSFPGPEHCYD